MPWVTLDCRFRATQIIPVVYSITLLYVRCYTMIGTWFPQRSKYCLSKTSDSCAQLTRTVFYFLVKITEILLGKQTVTYVFDLFYLPVGLVFSSHVLNGIWRSLRRAVCHVRDAADGMETPLLPKWTNKYLTVFWKVDYVFPSLPYIVVGDISKEFVYMFHLKYFPQIRRCKRRTQLSHPQMVSKFSVVQSHDTKMPCGSAMGSGMLAFNAEEN